MFKKALLWNLIAFLGLNFFVFSGANAIVANHVVINEIQVSGETTTDEFIRLYNPTGTEIALGGYRLTKITTSGSRYNLLSSVPDEAKIEPGSFFTVAHKDFKGHADVYYSSSSYSLADDNAVVLYSDAGKTEVDRVGYGINTFAEGSPAAAPEKNEQLKRKEDGLDIDNNKDDFVVVNHVSSGGNNQQVNDLSGVYINEIMPNPASPKTDSADEWIELFNSNSSRVDLSGAVLRDTVGSVTEFAISQGISIAPGGYVVFYSNETKIILNNSGDAVEFLDSAKKLIDSTSNYGNADDGLSFSLFSDGWSWTLSPTPLAENIFSEKDSSGSAKSSTSKTKSAKVSKNSTKQSTKSKGTAAKGAVKGASTSGDTILGDNGNNATIGKENKIFGWKNKNLGIFLIFIAALILLNFIIFREKIYEIYKQKFGSDA